jgi:hypothetical protein
MHMCIASVFNESVLCGLFAGFNLRVCLQVTVDPS